MTKVNLNNGGKKSYIFPWDKFKSDSISFLLSKHDISISMTFKIGISQIYD